MRRRQRWLLSWLKHERMTVAMALTEASHHTAPRGQEGQGRSGKKRHAVHGRDPGDSSSQPELFRLFEEELGGVRPEAFVEPRPQEKVQRHTMEQLADVAPMVPSLAVPESQMVDKLVAVIKLVDSVVPEQIIVVPKISWPSRFPRAVLREPQIAEQLVEGRQTRESDRQKTQMSDSASCSFLNFGCSFTPRSEARLGAHRDAQPVLPKRRLLNDASVSRSSASGSLSLHALERFFCAHTEMYSQCNCTNGACSPTQARHILSGSLFDCIYVTSQAVAPLEATQLRSRTAAMMPTTTKAQNHRLRLKSRSPVRKTCTSHNCPKTTKEQPHHLNKNVHDLFTKLPGTHSRE